MWETAFEESMLDTYRNLIVHCPNEELAESLMEIFERNGIRWCGGEPPTTMNTYWDENGIDTCYWVESRGCLIVRGGTPMNIRMVNMSGVPSMVPRFPILKRQQITNYARSWAFEMDRSTQFR